MLKTKRRREFSILLLLCWLSLHAFSFSLVGWHTATRLSIYANEIRAAEAEVRKNGGHLVVHIKNQAAGFDFDLIIMQKPDKAAH
jgi:hypothetical protein